MSAPRDDESDIGVEPDAELEAQSDINTRKHVVTLFTNYAATTKKERDVTLPYLANGVRDSSAATKNLLPWLKLARFGDIPSDKNSLRYDANVVAITGIELDYDGEEMPFDEAGLILSNAGLRCLIYTSPSHTEAKPRWRVLLPTSGELAPDRRAALCARANGLFGGIFAGESFTLSQAYYFGHVNGNETPLRAEVLDGEFIDERDDLDAGAIGKDGKANTESRGVDEAAEEEKITSVVEYYWPTIRLLGKWAHDGMAEDEAVARLRTVFERVPEDRRRDTPWRKRVDDIAQHATRIWAKEANKTKGALDSNAPYDMARAFAAGRHLRHHAGDFYQYCGTHYEKLDDDDIKAQVYTFLDKSKRLVHSKKKVDAAVRFKPKPSDVENVLHAGAALVHLSSRIVPPHWVKDGESVLACKNGWCRRESGWNLGDAITEHMKLSSQAARSIG